jgi:hypothetical protein
MAGALLTGRRLNGHTNHDPDLTVMPVELAEGMRMVLLPPVLVFRFS